MLTLLAATLLCPAAAMRPAALTAPHSSSQLLLVVQRQRVRLDGACYLLLLRQLVGWGELPRRDGVLAVPRQLVAQLVDHGAGVILAAADGVRDLQQSSVMVLV
jgi:hypothetical protein